MYRPGISENPPLKNQIVSHIVCQGGAAECIFRKQKI
jgi:hypothetical protein